MEFNEVMEMTAHQELDDILEEALKDEDVGTEEHGIRMDESFMSWVRKKETIMTGSGKKCWH